MTAQLEESAVITAAVDIGDGSVRPLVTDLVWCWVQAGSHGKIEVFEMFDQTSPHPILGYAIIEVPALPRKGTGRYLEQSDPCQLGNWRHAVDGVPSCEWEHWGSEKKLVVISFRRGNRHQGVGLAIPAIISVASLQSLPTLL